MSDTLSALHEAHKARRQRFFPPCPPRFSPPMKRQEPVAIQAIREPPVPIAVVAVPVIEPPRIPIIDLIVKVARFYKVSVKELIGPRRTKDIARHRQVAMFLAREILKRSYPEIGRRMGGRDHSTVIHSCDRITNLMETDAAIRSDVEKLREVLTQ